MLFQPFSLVASAAKAVIIPRAFGTAEAVPFPKLTHS